MSEHEPASEIFEALLEDADRDQAFPEVERFRVRFEDRRDLIDALLRSGAVFLDERRYRPSLATLRGMSHPRARAWLDDAAKLLLDLQRLYRDRPGATVAVSTIADRSALDAWPLRRSLWLLSELGPYSSSSYDSTTHEYHDVRPAERVLDLDPADIKADAAALAIPDHAPARLRRIEIDGYRPFRGFSAELGPLTAIIGANASGKSALLDFLRFAGEAADDPLPPEIDRGSLGRELFHGGGPAKIRFAFEVAFEVEPEPDREPQPEPELGLRLRYQAEIHGPVGAPRVAQESLARAAPRDQRPLRLLDVRAGSGKLRHPTQGLQPTPWTVPPNELALRRMLDPLYQAPFRLRQVLSSWRIYPGFDVSAASPLRQPALTESAPLLAENGHNLSAVLLWLQTEHPEIWGELEVSLRSVVPGFRSLRARLHGGRGRVMGMWREDGVDVELTLADLSDGTISFLCWAVLCLAPNLPPLVAVDEPERGLHPRVLPFLAGLFRRAAERSQIVVTTHAPHLLAQFDLDDIAVMRREDGRAVFARPGSNQALRAMLDEIGGDELMHMHVSDELETLA